MEKMYKLFETPLIGPLFIIVIILFLLCIVFMIYAMSQTD